MISKDIYIQVVHKFDNQQTVDREFSALLSIKDS